MKKIFIIPILLIALSTLVMGYTEPFKAELVHNSLIGCKNNLNLASMDESIKVVMPKGYCSDLGVNLRIEEDWCGIGGIPNLHFDDSEQGNNTICTTTLKRLYEDVCWNQAQRLTIGELNNKRWEIQFGWKNSPGSSYVNKLEFKVMNSDDISEKCQNLNKHNRGLYFGIPLVIICFILEIVSFKLKSKSGKTAGFVVGLLGLVTMALGFFGWF